LLLNEEKMLVAFAAIVLGLVLLVWSADRFVDGAAASAGYFGMSPLLIGMLIIGFGTSAPEIVVSCFAAAQGNPGVALGNAYGSNMANIGLVLGMAALIIPIKVSSQVLKKEMPILLAITGLAIYQASNGAISRADAMILLGVFALIMSWAIVEGIRRPDDSLGAEIEQELKQHPMSLGKAIFWIAAGLAVLVASSRLLVWGAVSIATDSGVSEVIIGLTIVAIGTSLPEVASTLAAVRKGETDMAIGNVIGSNLFNTLAVVGVAGVIRPMEVEAIIWQRDIFVMTGFTVAMFVFGFGFSPGKPKLINRMEGAILLLAYCCYLGYLVLKMTSIVGQQP
jgi:cation:H+ antiporter